MIFSQLRNKKAFICAVTVASFALPALPTAQAAVFAYPAQGQSQQKQAKDRLECHEWAVNQTGFNPNTMASSGGYSSPPPRAESGLFGRGRYGEGGAVADAGKGAAIGLLGGAIAGDASKGAAIGALGGTLFGGIKRSSRDHERQQWEQQQQMQRQQDQQRAAQGQDTYDRALGLCLGARGYQVQ